MKGTSGCYEGCQLNNSGFLPVLSNQVKDARPWPTVNGHCKVSTVHMGDSLSIFDNHVHDNIVDTSHQTTDTLFMALYVTIDNKSLIKFASRQLIQFPRISQALITNYALSRPLSPDEFKQFPKLWKAASQV